MTIHNIKVGVLNTNCYFISKKNKDIFIIDPGDEAKKIINFIEKHNFKPKYMLATHAHWDHFLAANQLSKKYKINLLINQKDELILDSNSQIASEITDQTIQLPMHIEYIDNTHDCFADFDLKCISTPGHSPGSISLYNPKNKFAIVGDTLFAHQIPGRTDLPGGNEKQIKNSIHKLKQLPATTLFYPGHGKKFTINNSLKYNFAS